METRYIAFLDILGFKDLLSNNNLSVLTNLYDLLQFMHIQSISSANASLHNKKFDMLEINPDLVELNSLIISDSIIIWTDNDSAHDFALLTWAVCNLLEDAFDMGIPLRGAISYGEILVQNGVYGKTKKINAYATIMGSALTRAYVLESNSEWSGCVIDNDCVEHLLKITEKPENSITYIDIYAMMQLIKLYKVPFKNGKVKEYYTVNWCGMFNFKFTEKSVRQTFSKHKKNIDDWSVEQKIQNTIKYMKIAKSDYIKYQKNKKTAHNRR